MKYEKCILLTLAGVESGEDNNPMISRIKTIQQVGVFKEFKNGGAFSLCEPNNKLVVIFGRNRNGKTTLSTILQSLGSGDPGPIAKRRSIPTDPKLSARIDLSYKIGETEESLSYTASGWSSTELKNRIFVFDQDFIHRNLMLGGVITRENKVNFTDFILGDKGVKESEDIARRKKNS